MANKRPWTVEDDARLRDLWAQGLSVEAIAQAIERTPRATYARAAKIGLYRIRRWTAAEDARLRQLWPDYSYRAVRAAFRGRTWSAIEARANRLGIRHHRTQGWVTLRAAERVTGVDHRTLKKLLDRAGVRIARLFRRNCGVELDAAIAAVTAWCRAGCPKLPAPQPTPRDPGPRRLRG